MSGVKKISDTKKKNRISVVKVFLLTFIAVVSVGLLGMSGYLLMEKKTDHDLKTVETVFEEAGTDVQTNVEAVTSHSLWEAIPTQGEQSAEEADGNQETLAMLSGKRVQMLDTGSSGNISFGFGGDILFDDEYACMANLLNRGVTIENGISEALLAGMHDVDVMMVNNEFPYTDRGTPTEGKTYTFRADPECVQYLHDMGVDVVSLANNHAYDFGEVGFLDTLDTLENAGIPYVGAGRNLKEACEPIYFVSEDVTVALVSATQIERLDNPDTKGATENSAGVFRCLYPEKLLEVIAEAKENSDFVIVYIHWGTENEVEPDWAQLDQAPKIAEAGADLIVGAHPHCLQGIEYYGDTPVIYSIGNFWFNSKTMDTGLLRVDISKEGIENLQFMPAVQQDCRTDYVYGGEKERILSYMESISFNVAIDSEGYITKK